VQGRTRAVSFDPQWQNPSSTGDDWFCLDGDFRDSGGKGCRSVTYRDECGKNPGYRTSDACIAAGQEQYGFCVGDVVNTFIPGTLFMRGECGHNNENIFIRLSLVAGSYPSAVAMAQEYGTQKVAARDEKTKTADDGGSWYDWVSSWIDSNRDDEQNVDSQDEEGGSDVTGARDDDETTDDVDIHMEGEGGEEEAGEEPEEIWGDDERITSHQEDPLGEDWEILDGSEPARGNIQFVSDDEEERELTPRQRQVQTWAQALNAEMGAEPVDSYRRVAYRTGRGRVFATVHPEPGYELYRVFLSAPTRAQNYLKAVEPYGYISIRTDSAQSAFNEAVINLTGIFRPMLISQPNLSQSFTRFLEQRVARGVQAQGWLRTTYPRDFLAFRTENFFDRPRNETFRVWVSSVSRVSGIATSYAAIDVAQNLCPVGSTTYCDQNAFLSSFRYKIMNDYTLASAADRPFETITDGDIADFIRRSITPNRQPVDREDLVPPQERPVLQRGGQNSADPPQRLAQPLQAICGDGLIMAPEECDCGNDTDTTEIAMEHQPQCRWMPNGWGARCSTSCTLYEADRQRILQNGR
jgi:hypothetical protein